MHFSINFKIVIRFPEGSTRTPNETTLQHVTAEVSLETPAGSKTDRAKLQEERAPCTEHAESSKIKQTNQM